MSHNTYSCVWPFKQNLLRFLLGTCNNHSGCIENSKVFLLIHSDVTKKNASKTCINCTQNVLMQRNVALLSCSVRIIMWDFRTKSHSQKSDIFQFRRAHNVKISCYSLALDKTSLKYTILIGLQELFQSTLTE